MKKLMMLMAAIGLVALNSVKAQSPNLKPDTATLHFVQNAMIGGLQEINSGNLAVKKGKSQDVKSFGAMMVKDHSQANTRLMQLVKSKGIQIPPQAAIVVPDVMLARANGVEFERNYVDMMLAGHNHTVSMFQAYAASGKDPDIKAFAQQTLPVLKQHLAAVKALAAKMKNVSM